MCMSEIPNTFSTSALGGALGSSGRETCGAALKQNPVCPGLTPEGWCEHCVIELDASGRITAVVGDDGKPADLNLNGTVIPGMPNLHSHAHQRAIAGLTEHKLAGHDDFWGWRERMYRANARLGPDELQAVARYVYSQMLQKVTPQLPSFTICTTTRLEIHTLIPPRCRHGFWKPPLRSVSPSRYCRYCIAGAVSAARPCKGCNSAFFSLS
ncbi:MAG: hypothetical protein Ct9H300mP16_04520 [Pseudomonadota bacterium]|nr:MAG: hypothetical protein Ct9H300mP16_04520 [Pseudomonadota bacterium]